VLAEKSANLIVREAVGRFEFEQPAADKFRPQARQRVRVVTFTRRVLKP